MDLVLVMTTIMSLLAVLLGHDLISREQEAGTLRMILSHAVSRDLLLVAKWLGGFAILLVSAGVLLGVTFALLDALPLDSPAQLEGRKIRMAVAEYRRVAREAPTDWSPTSESREVLDERTRKRQQAEEEMEEELRRRFARLEQDFLPRMREQEELVRALARWSLAAHFLHLTQGLASTSGADVRRFRETLGRHQEELNAYWLEKGRRLGWETPTTWEDAPRLALPAWSWRQWLDGAEVPDRIEALVKGTTPEDELLEGELAGYLRQGLRSPGRQRVWVRSFRGGIPRN